MDVSAIISVIGGIVSAAGAITMIIVAIRKTPHETRGMDVQTFKKYEETLGDALERALKLGQRVTTLECEIDVLKASLVDRDKLVAESRATIDTLQDWANRLVHQVISLGGKPVSMRAQKRDKNESKAKDSN